LSNYKLLGVLH